MDEIKMLFADLYMGLDTIGETMKKIKKANGLLPYCANGNVDSFQKVDLALNGILSELVLVDATVDNMRRAITIYQRNTPYGDVEGGTPLEKLAKA